MLKLFSKSRRPQAAVAPRFGRLCLEQLERRDCPAAPVITLSATVLPNHGVQLSGTVTDSQPQGISVMFSGAASGTTTTDANGNYSFMTTNANLGQVSAVGVDQQQLVSNTAVANIAVAAPTLTLSVTYGTQRSVTLSGQVTGIDAGNQTITFTGMVTGTVKTNADGTFSFTAQATGLGNVSAGTMDLWGQASNNPQATLSSNSPVITNFAPMQAYGTTWTFEGKVTDESPQGLTVTLGGIPALQGQTVTVGSNGWFYFTVNVQGNQAGTACAVTVDWWGLQSNEALVNFDS
jgi:hypothetical protein